MPQHCSIGKKKGVGLFGFTPLYRCGAGLLALCLLGGLAYWGLKPALCVRNTTKELVFFSPLPQARDFCIRFIHSVAKSPVEEWFQVQDGKIILDRTVYQDFGAGLPHEASTGQRMEFRDGLVVISGYQMHLPDLTVRVGRVAEHSLLVEQGEGAEALFPAQRVLPARLTPRTEASQPAPPLLFLTPRTEGKAFIAVPLQDMAPAGAALTFSVERCFWNYCAPWL